MNKLITLMCVFSTAFFLCSCGGPEYDFSNGERFQKSVEAQMAVEKFTKEDKEKFYDAYGNLGMAIMGSCSSEKEAESRMKKELNGKTLRAFIKKHGK